MRLICLYSLLLSLYLHFVHSSNQENFTEALQKLRIKKGLLNNGLKYDEKLETFGRENTPLDEVQSRVWWGSVKDLFTEAGCGILKGEIEEKMDENKTYDEEFYKDMLNKVDETFTHLLYDPRYKKVAAIFFHEGTEKTPFVIIFGGAQPLEDYVAKHMCFLRYKLMHHKFVDELDPTSNKFLNEVAQWTTEGQHISKELTVVNIPIENHDKQSIAFKIMITLDSFLKQPYENPAKEKLLLPNAQRLGVYVNEAESQELVIVFESIEKNNLVDKLMSYIQTKKTDTTEGCVWFTKVPDQELNRIAECIASEYGASNMSNNPSKDSAKKCGFDLNLFHGTFQRNKFDAVNYRKDNFQYDNMCSSMNDIFSKSLIDGREEAISLHDPKNIGFGIGFALVADDHRIHHFWNVFAIFKHTGGVSVE